MGQVYINLKTKLANRYDTGEIFTVTASGDVTVHSITGVISATQDVNPAHVSICNLVKIYSDAGEVGSDVTTASGAEVVGIVVKDDSGVNKLDSFLVIKRGVDLDAYNKPEVRILKSGGSDYTNSGHYAAFDITLGDGGSETESILVADNGGLVGHSAGELFLTLGTDGSLPSDIGASTTLKSLFAKAAQVGIKEACPYNIFNKKINYDDLGAGRNKMVLAVSAHSINQSAREAKAQITEYNTRGQAAADYHERVTNVNIREANAKARGDAEQDAVTDWYTELEDWQDRGNGGRDILSYTGFSEGPSVDPVWNAAVNAVSNWLAGYNITGAARAQERIDFFNEIYADEGEVFPTLKPPNYPTATPLINTSFNPVAVPSKVDLAEKISKSMLVRAACFAAIATLGGIYSRLKGVSTTVARTSSSKVDYCAAIWAEDNKDGVVVSWFKAEMRAYDIVSHLVTIFQSIGSAVGYIRAAFGPDGQLGAYEADAKRRIEAMFYGCTAGSQIESLKELYTLLGNYIDEYVKQKEINLKDNLGFRSKEELKRFVQFCDLIRGQIAVHLDGIAYYWQTGQSPKSVQPKIAYEDKILTSRKGYGKIDPDTLRIENQYTARPGGWLELVPATTVNTTQTDLLDHTGGGQALNIYGNVGTITPEVVSVTLSAGGNIELVGLNNNGGNGFFFERNSLMVRFPGASWFNPQRTAQSIMIPSTTDNVSPPRPSQRNQGVHKEINDPNENSQDLFIKYKGIFDSNSQFINSKVQLIANRASDFTTFVNAIKKRLPKKQSGSTGAVTTGAEENQRILNLISIKTWTPTFGECKTSEFENLDDDLAKTYFRDPTAYRIKIANQGVKESLCKKQSCGVTHIYSQAPQINETFKVNPENTKETLGDAMCGNVTVKYNLHPTAEWVGTDESSKGFFANLVNTTSSLDIDKELRIKNPPTQLSALGLTGRNSGLNGDITLPPIFGNYSFALVHDESGFWKKLFDKLIRIATLGLASLKLKDPTITRGISEYHKEILVAYNHYRLYANEFYVNGVLSPQSLTPVKTAGSSIWTRKDTTNFFGKHIDSLKAGYQVVADAGGLKAIKDESVGRASITPLLSVTQQFSGLCYPIVRNYGIEKKPWRERGEYISLGAWGPTKNDYQTSEEYSIGRDSNNAAPGNASHLPKPKSQLTNLWSLGNNNDPMGSNIDRSEQGLAANKKVFISQYPYFRPLFKSVQNKLLEFSTYWPRFEVEDFEIGLKLRKSGIVVGNPSNDFPLTQDKVKDLTDQKIEDTYCINVKGYVDGVEAGEGVQAIPSFSTRYGQGYWENPDKKVEDESRKEGFDSDNLKFKLKIPTFKGPEAEGNDYISGDLAINSGAALESAETQYSNYRTYINEFHLSGVPVFQTGKKSDPVQVSEKTGYANTSANAATAAAEDLLIAESEWYSRVGQTDSNGDPLARSGVKDGFPSRVTATWFGETWIPIEPAVVGTQAKHITGIGHDATAANARFTSLRASACNEGEIDGVISNTVTFSGSITGVGSTSGTALTNAMNALNTYSSGQYNTFGTGLNVARISPVNTAGADAHNFFTTGATTYDGGSSTSSGSAPLAFFDPHDSYNTSPNVEPWIENFLYRSAREYVGEEAICGSDLTCTRCDNAEVLSGSLDVLNRTLETQSCEVEILDPTGSATNWVRSVSGVRGYMYDIITGRLSRHEFNSDNDIIDGILHDSTTGTASDYSTGDFGVTKAFFPNTGALCYLEQHATGDSFGFSNPTIDYCESSPPSWATSGVMSKDDADNAITGESMLTSNYLRQIINLKDWSTNPGIDVYVLEVIDFDAVTVSDGDCYVNCSSNDSYSDEYMRRSIGRYGYRSAIFTPADINNISGAILTGSSGDGGTSLITSTTALNAPTVITGSGYCNVYDDHVWKSVVTGDYADVEARAYIPLLRNEYNARVSISGSVPYVTGNCDWSSNTKQVWADPALNSIVSNDFGETYEPSISYEGINEPKLLEYKEAGEKYYLNYGEGITGLAHRYHNHLGQKSVEVEGAISPQLLKEQINNPNYSVESDPNSESFSQTTMPSPLSLVQSHDTVTFNVRKPDAPRYFLGGWPIRNQASKETDLKDRASQQNVTSSFTPEYIVVDNGIDRKLLERMIKESKAWKKSKVKVLSEKEANKAVNESKQNHSNISKLEVKSLDIEYTKNGFTLSVDSSIGKPSSTWSEETVMGWGGAFSAVDNNAEEVKKLGKSGHIMFVFYYNAAACQGCVPTTVEAEDTKQQKMFFDENYNHFMQVDWELRSGDWQFEVPYMEAGQEISIGGKLRRIKPWHEYVGIQFMNQAADVDYTGHYTAFGQPFSKSSTQIPCPERREREGLISKFPKIVDFHMNLGEDASYTKLKDNNTNGDDNEFKFE